MVQSPPSQRPSPDFSAGLTKPSHPSQPATAPASPQPPHDIGSEETVIAAAMVGADVLPRIAAQVAPEDFFRERHGYIYAAELRLWQRGEPVTPVTVAYELGQAGLLQAIGGPAELSVLTSNLPTTVGVEWAAKNVWRTAMCRRLASKGAQIVQIAAQGRTDWNATLGEVTALLTDLSYEPGSRRVRSLGQVIRDDTENMVAWIDEPGKIAGIRTGLWAVDCYVDGLEPGRLLILMGATSSGKSMLALTLALNIAQGVKDQPPLSVYYASTEMIGEQLARRAIRSRAGIDTRRARWLNRLSQEEKAKIWEATEALEPLPVTIDDAGSWSWQQLASRIEQHVAGGRCAVAIIDHMSGLSFDGVDPDKEYDTKRSITGAAKALAVRLGIPIILVEHVNRQLSIRDREDRRPQLSDIRGSGRTEQDADIVLGWHRPAQWQPGLHPDDPLAHEGWVLVLKNRDGTTGEVKAYVDLALGRVSDWPEVPA